MTDAKAGAQFGKGADGKERVRYYREGPVWMHRDS